MAKPILVIEIPETAPPEEIGEWDKKTNQLKSQYNIIIYQNDKVERVEIYIVGEKKETTCRQV